MNFSKIPYRSFVGRFLRLPLRLLPKGLAIPIVQGSLRGKRWIVGSSNHGCWLGSYETGIQRVFEKWVKPGMTVYDLGAHVGYYTLLASTLVGDGGVVAAFEPLARNQQLLQRHLRINRCANVKIFCAAVSDHEGTASLQEGESHYMGHIGGTGTVSVRTLAIDDLVEQGQIQPPNFMKIDIEGAEFLALQGATKTIERSKPNILLSTHGAEVKRLCCEWLQSKGFVLESVTQSDGTDVLARPRGE